MNFQNPKGFEIADTGDFSRERAQKKAAASFETRRPDLGAAGISPDPLYLA
jgi:hypothetical protein